jgi:diacylglycerol kinase family enzyme
MSELAPTPHPIQTVDSFVVVTRRQTTNGNQGEAWAAALQRNEPHREVTMVSTDGLDETASGEALLDALQRRHDAGLTNPLLISAGGDGSLHYTAKRLVRPDTPAHLKDTLLTPWDLGYANDGHTSMHDPKVRGAPLAMLTHPAGHVLQTNPLEWTYITPEGAVVHDWSVLYGTLGPTAVDAALYISPRYRAMMAKTPKPLRKAMAIAWGLPPMMWPPHYDVHIDDSPGWMEIVEIQAINAERMAIHGDFSRSTHLADRAMHVSVERHRNLPAILWFAGRAAIGRPQGTRRTRPLTVKVRGGKAIPGQLDGEPFTATEVHVQPGQQALNIYVTKDA